MDAIEVIGHVDEQHRLHADLPLDVKPGPVKITVQPVTEEDGDDGWRALINKSWAQDWSDPREDIYTLEHGQYADGVRENQCAQDG